MRTFFIYACAALLTISGTSFLTGCVGDVAPQQKKRPVIRSDYPEDRSSVYLVPVDTGYTGSWPKSRNPCPGPACDPAPEFKPEWVSDPPPDYIEQRGQDQVLPPAQSNGNSGQK